MDLELLKEIGFSANEAKAYAALLDLKRADVRSISELAGIHRRNAYEALEKLAKRGFVAEIVSAGAKNFEVTNPERIVKHLKEKEEAFEKSLPELMRKYETSRSGDEARIFKSFGGIKAVLQDMLDVKSPIFLIGSKGYWRTLPELQFFYPQFDRKRVKLGIRIKQIFDSELRGQKITDFELGEARFFPKEYSTPIHIWIYGDRVVSVFYGNEPIAFMVKSEKIAAGYKKYFNFMWNHLAKK